ncbi:Alpha/Beta hydrolase protein [Rhodocollybia butyracea]|uniref:Alpha/Beta hydrolase protein n=1 Tax=Rhodocollybia butyracea TaxID=206335 RepID=A0A9P5Q4P1_9AGAR|nr:Alpha/Beta hydrolase protein [Rhodocollybia butyracea]
MTSSIIPKPLEILFKRADGVDMYMDVYLSPSASPENPAPILCWWHGGGLLQASVIETLQVLYSRDRSELVQGNRKVCPDYRLAPQFRLPTVLSDCADAVKFLHSEDFRSATKECADSSRVILTGSSAGGWLSFLCGYGIGFKESGVSKPPKVQGIVPIYPITDLEDPFWSTKQRPVSYLDRVIAKEEVHPFLNPEDPGSHVAFVPLDSPRSTFYDYMVQEALLENLLLSGTNVPPTAFSVARFLEALPQENKLSPVPPTYIVHGDNDRVVPVSQSRVVVDNLEKLREIGVNVDYEYEEFPGLDHSFDETPECKMEMMYIFIERVFHRL